jgi:hypothetical protein
VLEGIYKVAMLHQMVVNKHHREGEVDLNEFTDIVTKFQLSETQAWTDEISKEWHEFWRGTTQETAEGSAHLEKMNEFQDRYYGK